MENDREVCSKCHHCQCLDDQLMFLRIEADVYKGFLSEVMNNPEGTKDWNYDDIVSEFDKTMKDYVDGR